MDVEVKMALKAVGLKSREEYKYMRICGGVKQYYIILVYTIGANYLKCD
jgi:hypothetical protein